MRSDDEIYRNLSSAIVLRAVQDYREAVLTEDSKMMRDCERFFRSKYCTILARLNCDDLAEKIKSETLAFKDLAFAEFDEREDRHETQKCLDAFKCPTCADNVEVTYEYYSKKSKTFGYTAVCRSCGLKVRRMCRTEARNG